MTRAGQYGAIAAAILVAAGLVVLGSLAIAPGSGGVGSEITTVPDDDATVVATLRSTGNARSPALVAALRANRGAPDDAGLARAAARLLIAEGRAAGDSRLVGAALGVLLPVMEPPEAETLYLAATARQYQHDFPGALDLLDRAVALDGRNLNAILTRATVKMVVGRLADARRDCDLLSALRADVGFLCQATALIVTPQAPQVGDRLTQIVARPGLLPDEFMPWAIGLVGEIAQLRGDDAAARTQFEAALARDSGDLRLRLLLADLLLRTEAASEVGPLLADAPATDGVLLRRALAARALGGSDASAEAAVAERVRINRDLGVDAHAREDGTYHLLIAGNAAEALGRAEVNWSLQHEIEDAQLLIDAAVAAGQPAKAVPVLTWMKAEGIDVPALRIPPSVVAAAR